MASRTNLQPHRLADLASRTDGLALGNPDEAAWLIAPAEGLLLAATPAGEARLGFPSDPTDGPRALDRSMPALCDLLALTASDAFAGGKAVDRDLVFWTARGPSRLHCTCRRVDTSSGTEAILVRLETSAAPAHAPSSLETGATLSKIAERIRAGLRTRTEAQVAAASPSLARSAASTHEQGRSAADTAPSVPPEHLAKLAHELRTPVAAIASMAEIMRDERFGPLADARYRDYARSIHDSARHMLAVIESMLDRSASGTEGGETSPALTFIELNVNALAAAAVESIGPLAAEARLTLDTELAERLPLVIADQRCVRQILLNLLTNALKFTPEGGEVRVSTRTDSERRLWLEVGDTGRGMSTEEITRSMGAGAPHCDFAHGPRRDGGGYGLGLPLVHALAAANGARIEMSSTPGHGTCVSLVFPADRLIPI